MTRIRNIGRNGFTLIELVIAIGVFAVLTTLAYGGLRSILKNQELTAEHADRLARLQMVYRVLEQDFQQVVKRGIRNEYGDPVELLFTGTGFERKLEFTRGGWRNPAGQLRSSLQRVGYDLRDEWLVRENWNVLDRAQDSEPREQQLLDGVEDMQLRFLDDNDAWQETWPPLDQIPKTGEDEAEEKLPRGIEITLELEDWGKLTWLFQVNS